VTWRDVTWRDVTWRDVTWRDATWRDATRRYIRNRPWGPLGLWDVEASTFSTQLADPDGEIVSLTHRSLYPQGKFLVLISVEVWVHSRDIVGLETLCELKSRVNSSDHEPSTFRLVALYLCALHYRLPHVILWVVEIIEIGFLWKHRKFLFRDGL
jgi:hypothetical protein